MIDLHAHILPGFDDGARDWPTALRMCRQAVGDGISCVVATPHFYRGIFPTPEVDRVHSALQELRDRCRAEHIELDLLPGSDCHLHAELLQNLRDGLILTVNRSRYLLLELDESLPPGLRDFVFDLCLQGTTPIITHPERNRRLRERLDLLYELVQGGAYAQVTAGSLLGRFGATTQRAAEELVAVGLVQIIASDAHDPEQRPPLLSEAVGAAAGLIGDELARRMVEDVPRAILDDRPIDYPQPVAEEPPRKRRWWQRLLAP